MEYKDLPDLQGWAALRAVVEKGGVKDIFYRPQHPYTLGLLASSPRLDEASRATPA